MKVSPQEEYYRWEMEWAVKLETWARRPHPWDSPGKNTGVGCHFLLQCMKVKSESEVPQSCPTPSDPMDCSLPGSSTHGIFQARVLEWGATAFSTEHTYVDLKHTQCESCGSSFIWGKMRTIDWETPPQVLLRDYSKEAVGEGQYI